MLSNSVYSFALSLAACLASFAFACAATADDAKPIAIAEIKHEGPVDFGKEVQPLLKKHCVACHNATTKEGGLILESPQSILKGGDSGPGAVASKGAESLILKRASGQEEMMPPPENKANAKPLSSEELGLIKLWIDQGATGAAAAETIEWQPLPPGVNPIYAVAVTPDGQYAACGRANQVYIYHAPTGRLVCRLTDPELLSKGIYKKPGVADLDLVQSLAFSPDGYTLASGGYRTIKLWSRPRDVRVFSVDGIATESVPAVVLSPDGKLAATGGNDGAIKLWDAATGAAVRTLSGHTGAVSALRFSADGARLFSASADKTVRGWQTADGAATGGVNAPAPLSAVTLVGDGSLIAAGGADNIVRLWPIAAVTSGAVADAAPQRELAGHTQPITALATLSTAPTQILSGSADGSARLWNTADGQLVKQFDHGAPITAVAIRPDGARIATGGANGMAKLWNVADGKSLVDLGGDYRAQFQVGAAERAITGRKNDVAFLDAAFKTAEKAVASEAEGVKKSTEGVAAAEKGLTEKAEAAKKVVEEKVVAEKASTEAAAAAKVIEESKAAVDKAIVDADASAKAIAVMAAQAKAAADAAAGNKFLADAKAAGEKAVADATKQVAAVKESRAAIDKTAAEAAAKAKAAADALAAKMKAADDAEAARKQAEIAKTAAEQALVASNAAAKRATDAAPVAKAAHEASLTAQKESEAGLEAAKQKAAASVQPIRAIAFSPDNLQLATAGDDKLVHLWSAETGAPFDTYAGHEAAVQSIAFAGDGRLLSAGADKRTVLWELQPAWTWQRTIGGPESPALADRVTALDFSPDGKLLASGGGEPSRSGELKIWNVADGALAREIPEAHSDTIFSIDFSPNGQLLASCGADKFVKVFDLSTGKLSKAFEGHTHHVLSVAWQAQGRTLASGGADNVIKVWNFDTGEQARTISGFNKEVTSLAFVGASDEAVSCAGDKLVYLHSLGSGKQVRNYPGASDFMYSAAITPDGKLVVAGGQDSTFRAWQGADAKAVFAIAPPKP
ncbi:MAG TPA: c-type cytochrome domain-containing protein [Pirellulales bacterium]